MSMVDLPDAPGPMQLEWRVVDFGSVLTPALGGPVQRINRLGTRFALTVTLPPMVPADQRNWSAALTRGQRNGVRYRVRQVELEIGAPGAPVAAVAGQAGDALIVAGGTPWYAWAANQMLSIVSGGQRYCYFIAEAGRLDGSGAGTIRIDPLLRAPTAIGDAVEIGNPMIEGLLTGDLGWSQPVNRRGGMQFTITEMA